MGHYKSFLVLFILGCTLELMTAQDAPVPEPKPENKFLKVDDPVDTVLMECRVAASAGSANFDSLTWKKDKETEICTTVDDAACGDNSKYAMAQGETKYDLLTKVKVAFTHAGTYTCTITGGAAPVPYPGKVTVIEEIPTCTTPVKVLKGTKTTLKCLLKYKGEQKPAIKIGTESATVNDGEADADGVVTRTATLEVTVTEDKTYDCKFDETTKCTIDVKQFSSKVDIPPPEVTWAMENTAATIPCTMKAEQTYTKVEWFKTATTPATNLLCSGTADKEGSCTATGYEIDNTKKHNLKVTSATQAHLLPYICNVQTADSTDETLTSTLAAIKAKPVCDGKWDGTSLNLNCTVEYRGTTTKPTIVWTLKDDTTELKDSKTGEGRTNADGWTGIDRTVKAPDASTNIYVCHVKNGNTDLATCEQGGGGASAISGKFLQSILLSLGVLFILNRFQ